MAFLYYFAQFSVFRVTGISIRPEQEYAEPDLHSALHTAHVHRRRRVQAHGGGSGRDLGQENYDQRRDGQVSDQGRVTVDVGRFRLYVRIYMFINTINGIICR